MTSRRTRISPARLRESVRWLPVRIGYLRGPRLMSWLRKRWVLLRHPHADIRLGRGVYLGPGFSLHMPGAGSFIVGDGVEFRRHFRAEVAGDGRILIGSGTVFTYSVLIQCTTCIDIGRRCVFAQTTTLLDGQHRFRDLTRPMLEQGYDLHPLTIADDAAVMAKSTIMADLGERAFVGANSVVNRPVAAYTLVVGAPARAIEYFGPAPTPLEVADDPEPGQAFEREP